MVKVSDNSSLQTLFSTGMFLTTLKYTKIEIKFSASGQESNAIEHVSRNGLFSPSRDSVILAKQFFISKTI